jgi:uncharacterized protein (TIGR00255 family)
MIKSMTGFGQANMNMGELNLSIEVRSLNSKFLDLTLRLPRLLNDKEVEIRNAVAERLERGKISLLVDIQQTGKQEIKRRYNEDLFTAYYKELKKLADKVMAPYEPLFQLALEAPEVMIANSREEVDAALWSTTRNLILTALQQCDQFRSKEGKALEEKLAAYIQNIQTGLEQVEALDPKRIERIRNKIKGSVQEFFGNEGYDINRLEQEIIYYIEKLDIHEERVRLHTHLSYFLQLLADNQSNGKKLGFLSQEIGREINTIGSKANDAEMQRSVVMMKEELEKIKEQLNNVL